MIKKWAAILLCLIIVISFSACGNKNDQDETQADIQPETSQEPQKEISQDDNEPADTSEETPMEVVVTFDAMKEFVEAIGKDKVTITTMIPAGSEPHDFEPKAQDLVTLSTAQVFVYNGLGMEAWAEDAISAANNPDLIIAESSKGGDIIENEEDEHGHEDEDEHEEDEAHEEDGHDHGPYDPHIWLSLKGAEVAVKNIKDVLVQADPSNKDFYEQNYEDYSAQLENLFNEYTEKFQSVEKKNFVTGHAAFGYLCRDFGLEQNSVQDIFAEGEPTAQQLGKLIEYCRENNVTTIFAEEMASPAVSQTLANEVGANMKTIYTMESAEDDMTYLERMEENLSRIYESLVS